MNNTPNVEFLLHPDEHLFVVRPAAKDNRNAVKWTALKDSNYQSRIISGTAFLKTLYEMFGWKADCKYRVRGIRKRNMDESVYIFDMNETEVFIPSDTIMPDGERFSDVLENPKAINMKPIITTPKTVCAYPAEWAAAFGSDYYRHAQARELTAFSETGDWNINSEGQAFSESPLKVTNEEEIKIRIDQLIEEMRQRGE